MFKRILFATSARPGNDNAARVAFDLTSGCDARMFLLHVFGLPSRGFSQMARDLKSGENGEADADYQAWVREELNTIYGELMRDMPEGSVELRLAAGVPALEILRLARQEDADIIVIGAHNRDDDGSISARVRAVIGNTMREVARRARCPVLIVNRPRAVRGRFFSNIVFCTDFSKPADAAFHFAFKMARETGARLHFFHALDIRDAPDKAPSVQDEIEGRALRARERMQRFYLDRMGDFTNYRTGIGNGAPSEEILNYAREQRADLIVMAHHTKDARARNAGAQATGAGEGEGDEAEIGSTVEQVVLHSDCPVFSVNRNR